MSEESVLREIVGQMFDIFYDAYPRHEAKKVARQSFLRAAANDETVDMIFRGLELWTAYWKAAGTEVHYIPHPATWLNQERWAESPPPVATNGRVPEATRRETIEAAIAANRERRERR